ncbi:MAG: PTS sugar transporter subunit IIB [Epulopiscium sp. Nele67-Bin005]|nr:MAG: PTS sugar transporter subunit IIB [Epulopiscium sp. Nele67-Bin005]
MIKVAVFCAAGMSTSLLVKKIKEASVKRGIELEIEAYPESQMSRHTDVDCVLLGPQIQFMLKNAEQIFSSHNIPVSAINSVDYGMMNGDKVLDTILIQTKK